MEVLKKLPYSQELEEAIVAACLIESDCLIEISEFLYPKMFYSKDLGLTYKACYDLFKEAKPIDLITVTQRLRDIKAISNTLTPYYLTTITNRVASSANVQYHARIVSEMYMKRELFKKASEIKDRATDEGEDIFKLIEILDDSIGKILEDGIVGQSETYDEILQQAETEILNSDFNKQSGVTTGLTELDKVTSGLQPSDMIVLAARPAMGKSALMTTIIKSAAKSGKPCAIFSLEMSKFQLICRMISEDVQISANELVKKRLSDYQKQLFRNGIDNIRGLPIHIEDKAGLNIVELRAKMKRLKKKHDIQLAIIDYLQLMSGTSGKGNREQEISEISRGVKQIARELNIPIVALSQLSRSVETRGGNKIPQLSDLRESGAIEQDADMVMFLYRPEYYGIEQTETGHSTKGMAEIIIAKHRNGTVGTISTKFIGQYTCFKDWVYENDFERIDSVF